MQHRGTRLAILCVILLAGVLSGFYVWSNARAGRQLDEQRESKEQTIDRLLTSVSAISSAQQAYAENRHRDVASFTQVSVLIDRITTDAAGLRAATGSGVSTERLEEFWTALSALMGAGSRAREQFAHGDDNAASEAMLASARDHVTQLSSSLRAFRAAEIASYGKSRASLSFQSAAALGATALMWAIALVLFAVVPRRVTVAQTEAVVSDPPRPQAELAPATSAPVFSIDLAAAAALSTELGMLSDQSQLHHLLDRAAEIVDARGLVVWMGAGEELFAAAAHGYDWAVLQRIRPIPRGADNVTAAAWRTGQLRTVAADASGYGAIVAPLLNPSGCMGVLAAEIRHGRDSDQSTRAVLTIIASQLASVLAAWPAASTATVEVLDRKAAAS